MGVLKIWLSPDKDVEVLLNYLCQQSGKLYNSGVYLARQTFLKTGKLLTKKFDLSFEPSVSKSMVAKSLPSTPMQQTLMSVTEAFKGFKELRTLYFKGQWHFIPKPPGYLQGSKLFKVAYPNSESTPVKTVKKNCFEFELKGIEVKENMTRDQISFTRCSY
jgi:putative transposase